MVSRSLGFALTSIAGMTISDDGTTHKAVNYEARFIDLSLPPAHQAVPTSVPSPEPLITTSSQATPDTMHPSTTSPLVPACIPTIGTTNISSSRSTRVLRMLPIVRATGHTSEEQLAGWKTILEGLVAMYNRSPLGRASPLKLAALWEKVKGMLSDHSSDQRKLARLIEAYKEELDRRTRGSCALKSLCGAELEAFLLQAVHDAVLSVGGYDTWEHLSPAQQLRLGDQSYNTAVRALGQAAFDTLSADEKRWASLFIWAGCGMHKELNALKYGAKAMKDWWDSDEAKAMGAVPPIPLYNEDNAAAILDPTSSSSKARAEAVTSRGAIKLAELAGSIMRDKNSKKGQQDVYRWYFEWVLGYLVQFPDTSNTRFGSYGDAASELLVHLLLYVDFLEVVRDAKGSGEHNHMEQNVYDALRDPSTLTELAVLSLYSQAVAHPFIRFIRSSESQNVLELGQYYSGITAHIQKLAKNPSLLLETTGASYEDATLDGRIWQRPEAVLTVQQLYQDGHLPFLRPALLVFLRGAKHGWEVFMHEFRPGGRIDSSTPSERTAAAMRTTNDHSESAFGKLRQSYHARPSLSLYMRNAGFVHKHNHTEEWWDIFGTAEMDRFSRKEARRLDTGEEERADRARLSSTKKRKAEDAVQVRKKKQAKLDDYKVKVDSIPVRLSPDFWSNPANYNTITRDDIKLQLAWLRARGVPVPPGVANAKKADRLQGLVDILRTLTPDFLQNLLANETD